MGNEPCKASKKLAKINIKATLTQVRCSPNEKSTEKLTYEMQMHSLQGTQEAITVFKLENQDYQNKNAVYEVKEFVIDETKARNLFFTIKMYSSQSKTDFGTVKTEIFNLNYFFDKNQTKDPFQTQKIQIKGGRSNEYLDFKFETEDFKKGKQKNLKDYDFAWDIENFFDLMDSKKGWIYQRLNIHTDEEFKSLFLIVLIGIFNKGKTFVANMITGQDFDSGVELHTKGLSLILDLLIKGRAFLDSAGNNVPIPYYKRLNTSDDYIIKTKEKKKDDYITEEKKKEILQDRKALDWFQRNFILNYSHAITVVVGVLTVQEQSLIEVLNKEKPHVPKIIIHNLYQLKTVNAVLDQIVSDILYSFDVFPIPFNLDSNTANTFPFYFKNLYADTFHLVFVDKFKPELDNYFNKPALKILRSKMADWFKVSLGFNLKQEIINSMKNDFNNYYEGKGKVPVFKIKPIEKTEIYLKEKIYIENSFKTRKVESNLEGNFFILKEKSHLFETFIYISKPVPNDIMHQLKNDHEEDEIIVNVKILCVKPVKSYVFGIPKLGARDNKKHIKIEIKHGNQTNVITIPLEDKLEITEAGMNYLKEVKSKKLDEYLEIDQGNKIVGYSIPLKQMNKASPHNEKIDPDDEMKIIGLKQAQSMIKEQNAEEMMIDFNVIEEEDKIKGIETIFKNLGNFDNLTKRRIIGIVGSGGNGKTFLLNQLIGNEKRECFPTKSISVVSSGDKLFLDSESFYKPLKKTKYVEEFLKKRGNLLKLKNIKDNMFQKFILEHSNVFIIVVSHITYSDQCYIEKIISRLKDQMKHIFIIHNLSNIAGERTFREKIEDLKTYFNLKAMSMADILDDPKYDSKRKIVFKEYFEGLYQNLNVYHFILGGDENKSIKESYNITTIEYMKNIIETSIPKSINLEKEFNEFCQKEFSEYFYMENSKMDLNPYPDPNKELMPNTKSYRFENPAIILKLAINSVVGDENQYLEYKPYYEKTSTKAESNETIVLDIFFPLNSDSYEINPNCELKPDKKNNKHMFYLSGNRKMYEIVKNVEAKQIIENDVQEGNFSLAVELCSINEKKNNKINICKAIALIKKNNILFEWIDGVARFKFTVSSIEEELN